MTQWLIDPAHTEVKFKVKHLVISTVTGQFRQFSGSVISEKPDFSDAQVSFAADVTSISTNNDQRDGHLKSPDFFDAASYPSLTFTSTSITQVADNEYTMRGTMTIRGVAKEVTLSVIYNGTVKGFEGDVAAFEITGKLNRQDFGLRWNALTESGGVVVSDEVKLEIAAELKKVEVPEPEMA
jgi:polyisoprenoid-binding protein YceI